MPPLTPESVKDLLPNIDCGLCGNTSCATFARRISADLQKPEECIVCPGDRLGEIHSMLETGILLGESVQNERVVEMSPCAEYGKVTVEIQLKKPEGSPFDLFDPCYMCNAFHDMGMLDKVRCSLKMGYAIAEHKGKRLHIFKRGKVVMRAADSRSDALETLTMISKALWPTVICSCGDLVVDCLGSGSRCSEKNCHHCDDNRNCAALGGKNLEWGYENGITKRIVVGTAITEGGEEIQVLFSKGIGTIDREAMPLISEISDRLANGTPSSLPVVSASSGTGGNPGGPDAGGMNPGGLDPGALDLETLNERFGRALKDAETDLNTSLIEEENERLVTHLAILGYLNSLKRVSDALYELSSREKYDMENGYRELLRDIPPGLERMGKAIAGLEMDPLHEIGEKASGRCEELRKRVLVPGATHEDAPADPAPHIFRLYHAMKCTGSMLDTL